MSTNGKGDKKRPKSVSYQIWSQNYEKIFGHNKKQRNGAKKK